MVDCVNLIGIYNNKDLFFTKNEKGSSLYYDKKYYYIPSYIKEPETITLIQAIKVINNRLEYEKRKELSIPK